MFNLRNADQVKDLLDQHGLLTGPLANWSRYQSLASAIVHELHGGRELTSAQVERIVRNASVGHGNTTRVRTKLTRLLEHGKLCGLWESPFPSIPTVSARPSAAPVSPSQQQNRAGAADLERYFRAEYLRPDIDSETALLGAALLLVTRVGAAEAVIYGVLANLRRGDFDEKTGWVSTPSHPAVNRKAVYRFKLPKPLAGLLRWQRRTVPRRNGCWFFNGALPTHTGDDLPDAEEIKRCIGKRYRRLVEDYQSDATDDHSPVPKSFPSFVGAGCHRARDLGLAPQWLTVMAGYPLPVSSSSIALLECEPVRTMASQLTISEPSESVLHLNDADLNKEVPSALPGNFDWQGFVGSEINAFIFQLKPFCAPEGGVTTGREGDVDALLNHFDARASSVLDTATILRVLLRLAVSKLLDGGVKHHSLKTMLGHLCDAELLREPACLNLSTWDQETVLELTELRMSQEERSAVSTRQAAMIAWVGLLNFAHSIQIGHFPPVTIDGLMSLPAGRTEILTPDEAARIHWRLTQRPDATHRKRLMLAGAFSLGVHAGLRASEVINTKLANIDVNSDRVALHIPRGKTRNSRRTLWLHSLLPTNELDLLVEFVEHRSNERSNDQPLDEFYLFGPEGNPMSCSRELLIDTLIPEMCAFVGRTVDFHLLRHSFCSWLVVQAYLIQDPQIGDHLPGLDQRLKDPVALAALEEYLRYPLRSEHRNAEMRHDMWNRLARVMGHSRPLTFMTTYAHTIGSIHSVFLDATSDWTRRDRLWPR